MKLLLLSSDRSLLASKTEIRNSTVERLNEYAAELGIELSVIVHSKGSGFENCSWDSVTAFPTNESNPILSYMKMRDIGLKLLSGGGYLEIIAQDPFAYGEVGLSLKGKTGLPLLVNVFSSFFDDPYWVSESIANRIFNETGKKVVRAADGVRVECETERKKMTELGVSPAKIFISPVVVDLEKFVVVDGSQIRGKYLHGSFDRIALYIGRLSREKDVVTLLRAAAETWKKDQGILFLVVGTGPEEGNLKQLAEELHLQNVVFAGKIPYSEVPSYHAAADVFVLPSVYEGVPLVLVEAHAAGKPVVCTDLRDAPDVMLDGKSGFIVPQKDYGKMAERIIEVVRSGRGEAMGAEGRKYVMKLYDKRDCLKKFADAVRKTAGRG